jgi:hypothetical protein
MIRLILALSALMALQDAFSQDMQEVSQCMERAIGWQCPDAKAGASPYQKSSQVPRYIDHDSAKVYCTCRVLNNYDSSQNEACLALSRACEFGDI